MLKTQLKKLFPLTAVILTGLFPVFKCHSQSSVLQNGKWYKVAIEKNGVYRIDRNLFKKMGFDPGKTDPRRIKIFGNGGGMLPQANSSARPTDLIENAIYIAGESDGIFHSQDYILFYAQGPDKVFYDVSRSIFNYEKNLYATKNYYFITVGESNGIRIDTTPDEGSSFPVVNTFQNFIYHEIDQYNELKSGREWFGEKFDIVTEFNVQFNLTDVVDNSTIRLVSDVMAQSIANTSFNVFMNDVQVVQQNILAIPNTQYGVKGRHKRDTLTINEATVSASTRSLQEVRYQYIKSPSVRSVGYLDFCMLQVTQQLKLTGQQTLFRSEESLQQPVSHFEIGETTAQALVWDITNPVEPVLQTASFSSGATAFSTPTTELKEFIVFLPGAPAPELAGSVSNQNLHGLNSPDAIIVSHPDFRSEAQRLADHRSSFSGLDVVVVTTEEIFHEFSSGKPDITAIRDFARYLNDKSPGTLNALLLFGKCSYDYKGIIEGNRNYVPTYESRNSLHPLQTYSSDDFFGFLESSEGEWPEEPAVSHTLDIGVGRLPVKSITEAANVVNKLIRYDTETKLFNRWRKDIVLVGDDGDFNIHQDQADQLAQNIEASQALFDTKKIYLDIFAQPSGAAGQTSPDTRKAIEKAFNEGALVINYTGHGGERIWAQERIFDEILIEQLENKRMPLMITATCEFGRQDDPVFISGGEMLMLRKNGGAIGLVTTARPVNSSTNFNLNEAFYEAFFQKENDRYLILGEIFRRTKNNSIAGVANRNFSLIGDPSMSLAMPEFDIRVDQIETQSSSDTLKALSHITVAGTIINGNDEVISDFNGVLQATLFDKETSFITLGNENQPFPYNQWYNALFRGQASVENGNFEFEFIMPKNIAYSVGVGKLSLYAYDEDQQIDASGFSTDFKVGLSEPNPPVDNTPPIIELFMGDTTFINGGVVSPTTQLVARLSDESGINISGYGIGNSILAALDDSETIILNNYYEADTDNFTKGKITFPLADLTAGKHSLTLKAWDTHNNPAQTTIEFVVTGEDLRIETFGNYPNPFTTSTQLFFTHNRAGDDLEGSVSIFDRTGHQLTTYDFSVSQSNYYINLLELTHGSDWVKNLSAGLYFARLTVRSLANGSKNEQVTKLIIAN